MRRIVRLLVALSAVAVLVAPAAADARSAAGPAGLHGFLLRADEPLSTSFPRTPSFGWSPVPGALRYEFQLSTSSSFRENGIVFSDTSLTTPVAAPGLTLPWITGEPHALYARVRAVLEDTTTEWSAPFGFDMEPAQVAAPLPSSPGLLRWTPVEGATSYEVWFVDLPKIIRTQTNVADEREFYTLHQAASWLSTVRWRVRARRLDLSTRANGLPASTAGAWSPVYSSVNPPFAVGPLRPAATVSDVVATGVPSGPSHRLMPAFVFNGNANAAGVARELYRVQVFTDRKCINRVYTSAVIGSPAYAPRRSGPLQLPRSSAAVAAARDTYLPDGAEGASYLADGDLAVANESLPDVQPTTGLPAGTASATPKPDDSTASAPTTPAAGTTPAAPAAPATPAAPAAKDPPKDTGTVDLVKATGAFGPPIDIWDTDWANGGGYYWTVIPVDAIVPGAATTSVSVGSAIGATTLPVVNGAGFGTGDSISVGVGVSIESATVTGTTATTLTVGSPLRFGHGNGEPVTRTNGTIEYRDGELAQDACAAGRVMRFGKESEPSLTGAGDAFASGLTPDGKLGSADGDPAFYGPAVVSWTTALGSSVYAVQWSKTRHPFRPEPDPATNALGMLTPNTSAVLPLEPGTWYYRVRGYSYSLPTGSQALSWSDPQKIVSAKPTFKVVDGGDDDDAGTKVLSVRSGGFAVRVPSSWSSGSRTSQARAPRLAPVGSGTLRLAAGDGKSSALFVQTASYRGAASHSAWTRSTVAAIKKTRGRTGSVTCASVSLPAATGVRCSLSVKTAGSTQAAVVYALDHRGATYTLTFATVPRASAAKNAVFAAAARSFRFTR
jgi:hypothetical protein